MRTLLLSLSIWAAVSWPSPSWSDSRYSSDYDVLIRIAVERYWPGITHDWRWWKAQLIAESNLDPNARSSVGAEGIAQFMPRTWDEVRRDLKLGDVSPREAKYAILAGAYYMLKVSLHWMPNINAPADSIERLKLAQASYNAGAGNILKAQRRCDGVFYWREILVCLPAQTGRHAKETIGYVNRIDRIHRELAQ